MHRCLQIPEIVYLITQSLSPNPQIIIANTGVGRAPSPSREATKTLSSLSLTSKFFLEPCLDALWGCMGSEKPLLNLIVPPDRRPSLEDVHSSTHAIIMKFVQIIDEACWSRFHYYANRIRSLTVGLIDPRMGRALSIWKEAHGMPLLPNLRHLEWHESTPGLYPCMKAFAGPSLIMLKLTVEPWPGECDGLIYPVLASLRTACPLLTALEIGELDDGAFYGSGRQLSLILAALPSITRVGFCIEPSSDTILSLSTMPNLHTVINRMYQYANSSAFRPEPVLPYLPFPALRNLRWSAPRFKDSTAVLAQLQPGRRDLRGLAIHCDEAPTASDLADLLHVIHATCTPHALNCLALEYAEFTPFPPGVALSISSLTALLGPFGSLQACRLAGLPIALDDALLAALAAAWPALQRLELQVAPLGASAISLAGLRALADRCPRLAHLEAEVGVWPDDAACGAARHSPELVIVYCGDLEVLGAARKAHRTACVRGVFPRACVSLGDAPERWTEYASLGEDILGDLV